MQARCIELGKDSHVFQALCYERLSGTTDSDCAIRSSAFSQVVEAHAKRVLTLLFYIPDPSFTYHNHLTRITLLPFYTFSNNLQLTHLSMVPICSLRTLPPFQRRYTSPDYRQMYWTSQVLAAAAGCRSVWPEPDPHARDS